MIRRILKRLWRIAKWGTLSLVILIVAFYFAFVGLLEMGERQWLGKAPKDAATNVRIKEPHQWALLDIGADSLATRLRLINEAHSSIDLEFFIYELDTASRLVSAALEKRAQEGVKVRVIVDFAKPVFKLRPLFAKKLQGAGVQIRYYNTAGLARFFAIQHRTHRKMVIVDGKAAIIGGRNIGDDYFDLSSHYNFLDSDVLVRGKVVASMVKTFDLYWNSDWVSRPGDIMSLADDDNPTDSATANASPDAQGRIWLAGTSRDDELLKELLGRPPMHTSHTCNDVQFVTDYPGAGVERRQVYGAVVKLAKEAKKTIRLESPYFVLRSDGLQVVSKIADKGISLQILTNGLYSTDAYYTVAALVPTLNDLKMKGLHLYGYGGIELASQDGRPAALGHMEPSSRWGVHAKRAVFDDRTVAVGTYNIDPRSANLNSELMLVCRGNTAIAHEAIQSFEKRKRQAISVLGDKSSKGLSGLLQGADDKKVALMYAVMPLAHLFDFLL